MRGVVATAIAGFGIGGASSPAIAQPLPQPADVPGPVSSEPTPPPSAQGKAEFGTSRTEPDALVASVLASHTDDANGDQSRINVYGFSDFTYAKQLTRETANPEDTFYVGNLNLYVGSHLGAGFRSLAEVRFLYLPNGQLEAGPGGTLSRTSTTVSDYADLNRPVQWGGILIERAYLEYDLHRFVSVRAGQFVTPYGIWNVDHGSPVIIGTRRPYVVGEALFPERQTGLEFFGKFAVGATQFGYHLTFSNGRGPTDTYQDLDHNKALGGRLFVQTDAVLGTLTVGVSGYRGKYTSRNESHVDVLAPTHIVTAQYDEFSLAADAKWVHGGALAQAEVISNEVAYNDSVRPSTSVMDGGPPGFIPDNRRWGGYVLGGYRTSYWGTMPYVTAQYYFLGRHAFVPATAALAGGLNVRPTARVVLKAQYLHSWFAIARPTFSATAFDTLEFQAAWSF